MSVYPGCGRVGDLGQWLVETCIEFQQSIVDEASEQ